MVRGHCDPHIDYQQPVNLSRYKLILNGYLLKKAGESRFDEGWGGFLYLSFFFEGYRDWGLVVLRISPVTDRGLTLSRTTSAQRTLLFGMADPFDPVSISMLRRSAEEVAVNLLGRYLVRETGDARLVLKIVETEAYLGSCDTASHASGGRRTKRNQSLYLPGGFAYVYLIYGVHHCLNVVTGTGDDGDAVLIRAGEPIERVDVMAQYRGLQDAPKPGQIAGGPGKLCQAMGVDRRFDGVEFGRDGLFLTAGEPICGDDVVSGPRVGLGYAGEAAGWPLRFAISGHPDVSRPKM